RPDGRGVPDAAAAVAGQRPRPVHAARRPAQLGLPPDDLRAAVLRVRGEHAPAPGAVSVGLVCAGGSVADAPHSTCPARAGRVFPEHGGAAALVADAGRHGRRHRGTVLAAGAGGGTDAVALGLLPLAGGDPGRLLRADPGGQAVVPAPVRDVAVRTRTPGPSPV